MLKLFTLLCAGIFLTMLLAPQDGGPVRYGLMPGKIPSLAFEGSAKPAKTRVAQAEGPEPQVVALADAAPATQPSTVAKRPAAQQTNGLIEAAYSEPEAQAQPGLTLSLPLVRTNDPQIAAQSEPEPAPLPDAEPFVQYVQGTSVNVRSGPSADTEALTRLDRGEAVLVLPSDTPGWSMIRIEGDGVEGYIATRFLGERIEDGLFNSVD